MHHHNHDEVISGHKNVEPISYTPGTSLMNGVEQIPKALMPRHGIWPDDRTSNRKSYCAVPIQESDALEKRIQMQKYISIDRNCFLN